MDKVQEYINVEAFHKNLHEILEENDEKFDTHKDLLEYGLAQFTEEQIDETIIDKPYLDDKKQFWYAARTAYIDKLENMYLFAQNDSDGPFFNKDIRTIDASFNDTIGAYTHFFESLIQYSMLLEKVEESGLGDIFREL